MKDALYAATSVALFALGTELLVLGLPVAADAGLPLALITAVGIILCLSGGAFCVLGMSDPSTGRLLMCSGTGVYGALIATNACLASGMELADAAALLLTATPAVGFTVLSALIVASALRS